MDSFTVCSLLVRSAGSGRANLTTSSADDKLGIYKDTSGAPTALPTSADKTTSQVRVRVLAEQHCRMPFEHS